MTALAYEIETNDNELKIEKRYLQNLLLSLGIPPNVNGYAYIVCALELISKDPTCIRAITKGLYIDLAKQFKTKPACIERGMRHAIVLAWKYGDKELLNDVFKNCVRPNKSMPTNTVFLARLYYYITNREDVQ